MLDQRCPGCGHSGIAGPAATILRDPDVVAARHDGPHGLYSDRGRNQVLFLGRHSRDGVVRSEVVNCGQREGFLLCAPWLPLHWQRAFIAGENRHPARSGLSVNLRNGASQRPFDGNPYTRLAVPIRLQSTIWAKHVFVSRLVWHGDMPNIMSSVVSSACARSGKAMYCYQLAREARIIYQCSTARRCIHSKSFLLDRILAHCHRLDLALIALIAGGGLQGDKCLCGT